MKKVLLLNQHNLPLNVLKFKKAFNLLHKDKAELVEGVPNTNFYHNGKQYCYPSIIRMKYFVNVTKKRNLGDYYTKLNVWKRDRGLCQYCGKKTTSKNFTVDHVTPKLLGGTTRWDNIVTACFRCNNLKDCNRLGSDGKVKVKDEEGKTIILSLIRKPVTPEQAETIEQNILHRFKNMDQVPYNSWWHYIKTKKGKKSPKNGQVGE